jgi:hypothetical protein
MRTIQRMMGEFVDFGGACKFVNMLSGWRANARREKKSRFIAGPPPTSISSSHQHQAKLYDRPQKWQNKASSLSSVLPNVKEGASRLHGTAIPPLTSRISPPPSLPTMSVSSLQIVSHSSVPTRLLKILLQGAFSRLFAYMYSSELTWVDIF